MNSEITHSTLDDIPELNKLVNSAYRGEESKKGWTTEADLLDGTRTNEEILRDILLRGDTTILKYEEQNRLLGCVELRIEGKKLYLGMLSVSPDIQSKGIGRKLLEASEVFAHEHHCSSIFMNVFSVREILINWYIREGYLPTGQRKPFSMPDARWGIPKQKLEFVVLEKKLRSDY